MRLATLVCSAALTTLAGCATTRQYVSPTARAEVDEAGAANIEAAYQVFLVGDLGAGDPEDAEPVLTALQERLAQAGSAAAVVFLGDQLPQGMPDSSAAGRPEAEARLRRIADAVDGFEGEVFLVAGERDWRGGADAVRRQERFIEGLLDRENAFLPGDARAGPTVAELEGGPILIGIDSQWWLEDPESRPTGGVDDVDVEVPGDVLRALEDLLAEHDDANVLVVGHHPVKSAGPRAGNYPLSTYLLPPVLGAAVPLYRTFIGGPQDLASPRYRAFRAAMETVMRTHDGVVYAAAHEHALAAYRHTGVATKRHYLSSGSAAGADAVAPGGSIFAHGAQGLLVLRYAADGSLTLESVTVENGSNGDVVAVLRGPIPAQIDNEVPAEIDPADRPPRLGQRVVAAADSSYLVSPTRRFFFGRGYRQAWAAPVEVPVLDVGSDYGGLTPLQQGGGLQSVSIRFEGGDGHQYQLRLLRKRSAETIPRELRTAVVEDVFRDLTSATNPYSALSAAALLDATSVLHATPRVVYVPDDARLGRFRHLVANQLALIEIRPDDDMSDRDEFGNSDDVVSSSRVIEEMRGDHDHRIDQRAFLRARLMDLMMADWDRHLDQWRWAGFDPGQLDPNLTGEDATRGKVYLPIPRDRDFAFYRIGGLFPGLAKYFQPKLQNFEEDFGSIRGLTYSGIPLDRRFLSELEWSDWQQEIRAVQAALTDDVVRDAFGKWPASVFAEYGEQAIADFIVRRGDLPRAAERFFRLLAMAPDVLGSDEREHVTVRRQSDGSTEVHVRHASSDGEPGRTLFRRTFLPRETREVRLWAMGGRDWLVVEGDGPARIRVRFIGGAGEDVVVDRARSGGVLYYDDVEGNRVEEAGRVALRLSDDPAVNRYDPLEYERYPVRSFYPDVAYDATDGALLGAGVISRRPRFRGQPIVHDLSVRVGTTTGAIEGRYALRDPDRWGRGHGLMVDLLGASARNVRNFYGFGTNTERPFDDATYRVPLARGRAEAAYLRRLADAAHFRIGPAMSYTDVRADTARFATFPGSGLTDDDFEPQIHVGAGATVELSRTDDPVNPRQGLRWTTGASGWAGASEFADDYARVGSDLVFYVSPSYSPQITVASRLGAAHATADVPFFDAPAIGGNTLRGFQRERFTGNTAAYQSLELRAKLFTLSTVIIPLEVGALAFVDNGRVWADGAANGAFFDGWHQAYGGGLWIGLVGRAVFTATVGSSSEGSLFSAGLGFNY